MLDTTKYDGHTPGPWAVWGKTSVQQKDSTRSIAVCDYFREPFGTANKCNAILIADAPLLLEEIKRLQAENHNLLLQADNTGLKDKNGKDIFVGDAVELVGGTCDAISCGNYG